MQQKPKTYQKTPYGDKAFFSWTAENLPSRQEYFITNIDELHLSSLGRLTMVERKLFNSDLTKVQSFSYQVVSKAIQAYLHERGTVRLNGIETPLLYKGFKLIQYSRETLETGNVLINRKPANKSDLLELFCDAYDLPEGHNYWKYSTAAFYILRDTEGNTMLIEKGTGKLSKLGLIMRAMLDQGFRALGRRAYVSDRGNKRVIPVRYHGLHAISFGEPNNHIYDGERVTCPELAHRLNFQKHNYPKYAK